MESANGYKAENAIIMAAGVGERLFPLTKTTPKPLIEVQGKRMIESIIDSLIENDITEIVVVVGHLKEQFDYLPRKYPSANITLLLNPYYDTCNNISSLYVAREYLGNSIITDGDMIIHNSKILDPYFQASGYCSSWAEETLEWLQKVDEDDYVKSCSRTGGQDGWQLYSISFWSSTDSSKLRFHLEELFEKRKVVDIYWDDIPMFYYKEDYSLKIRRINSSDLDEIDNLEELYYSRLSFESIDEI
jgi:CTP:phosphocholine cytidylyltransferase-like protein